MKNSNEILDFRETLSGIITGDLCTVKSILSLNPNLLVQNYLGESLLHTASDNCQYLISEYLLSLNADPNNQNS